MSRPFRTRGIAAFALVLVTGCQDYNFNPVGHCLIQPGTKRETLSNVSTADVLFVIDDSGSMGAEQTKLAANFNSFIQNLDGANAQRASNGLEPIDFHIAVTTTSVFWNAPTTQSCRSDCPGAPNQTVCCTNTNLPARQPKACTPGVTACPAGTTCGINCTRLKGENYCCNQADGSVPAAALTEVIPCSRGNAAATDVVPCGTFERHFDFPSGCDSTRQGTAVDEWPHPRGDFTSWSDATRVNPRVLHFDKQLYTGTSNRQGFTRQELVEFFAGSAAPGGVRGNVIAGTCGSGMEQGLQAARLALEKAVAGQQKDTYGLALGKVKTWDPATRTAGSPAEWLHPNSKLVLVFVGDEDDCSSPEDPSGGVVMAQPTPGSDSCTGDTTKRLNVVTRFVDYFTGLVDPATLRPREVGAAFIVSTAQTQCSGDSCSPGACCQPDCPSVGLCGQDTGPNFCGGQAAGTRFFAAATALRAKGADVVIGSICDPQFDVLLGQIAEIVKPPSGLTLPTRPAEDAVTLLRIADAAGQTRKVCGRPLAAGSYPNLQAAQATGADWWFTASADVAGTANGWNPVAVSQFVYINPQGSCIANPGETYSADYLGRLPEGGCASDGACQQVLGGEAGSWTCFAGVDAAGACIPPTAVAPGTCLCGRRSDLAAAGSIPPGCNGT